MTERYDEKYNYYVSRLSGAFSQERNDMIANLQVFDKARLKKRNIVESMPYEELRKIREKVRSEVTDISYLTEKQEEMIKIWDEGRRREYRQFIWRLRGDIDIKKIMQNYVKFIQSDETFRTVYLYKGLQRPVRVVCESVEKVFPIHDIRNIARDKQMFLMKNVLAAEARREYNAETDSVFRIQGYLVEEHEMLAVISIYPYIAYPMGIKSMLYKIFAGMKPEDSNETSIDEDTVRKMNTELREMNIAYWKKLLLPISKSMTIPGEKGKAGTQGKVIDGKTFLYKEIGEELNQNLTTFCERNKVSVKALFLYAWADLLGRYHNEMNPILAVAGRGERMNIFPVKISRDSGNPKRMHDIDKQLEQAATYSNCTISDVEGATNISYPEYFRMVHSFMEFGELNDIENGDSDIKTVSGFHADETDINLCITYQIFDNSIMVNYVSKSGIMQTILENLHELLVDELSMLVMPDDAKLNRKTFIQASDTDEEKLYKTKLVQIALYLKNSGIFESITLDEIMKLAEHCRFATYLSNDVVVSEKSRLFNVYILGDGNMEESMTAADGMVRTLRIVKKGSVFGIESLFADGEAKTTYTVVSSQAKIVEIDREIFTEVLRRKPEGWITLLEKENNQKNRLQRLWTME